MLKNNALIGGGKARAPRLHNLELLRIVAMLMVLFIHYNLPVRGKPSPESLQSSFLFTSFTIFLQSVLIVCVNCFVLISGWFGIRWKSRSLANLCFQVAFWAIVCYAFLLLVPYPDFDSTPLVYLQFVLGKWFVWAYFGLYLMAPVLNAFVEKTTTKQLAYFVVAFYTFCTLFGYFSKAVADFNEGMSVISLSGLYLIGALLRRVEPSLPRGVGFWASGYALCVVLLTVVNLALFRMGIAMMPQGYLNPVVIVESVCLFMIFQRMRVNFAPILFFSSSAYAVYLGHSFPADAYGDSLRWIVASDLSPWAEAVAVVGFILAVFVGLCLIDKFRIALFNRLWRTT